MHTDALPETPLFKVESTPSASNGVTLIFEEQRINAPAGISIAAALLLNGVGPFRATPVKAAPRAPYCMMGVCFDCLVEVDGVPSRQACLVPVREGMVVKRQLGAAAVGIQDSGEDDAH